MEMKIPMLDLVRLHAPLRAALAAAFEQTLATGRFIGGPAVEGFEDQLADHVGAGHAVAVSSGTDALLVSLMALGAGPGDEVITSPYTFFATAGCIARTGATPVFVDIEPDTFNIDVALIEAKLTDRTVGIVPVHLFGQCADLEPLLALGRERGLWVLEDAAQALGAQVDGQMAGALGTLGTFSFFPAKNLGALGDGGAVVTNDSALAGVVGELRQHGAQQKYRHELVGGNFRLDALQAALLSVKLPHLRQWEAGRRNVAERYGARLGNLPGLTLPLERPGQRHVFNQYVIRTTKRDAVARALTAAGIGSAVYYPVALHLQKCFESLGYKAGAFPESERASEESLAIPVDPLIEAGDQQKVAEVIKEVLQ
jgi:dTDP-4-amino-4,6-dideoxygalactose transaminase